MKKKKSKDTVRKIMIATPSHDGKLDAWHSNALVYLDRICREKNILIDPIYLCYESIIVKARNDLFSYGYKKEYDDIVYIDADIVWTPDDFINLISHQEDIVSGIYPKKSNIEEYPINIIPEKLEIKNNLLEVATVPTGFLKISRNAMEKLWNSSNEYKISQEQDSYKLVFETGIIGNRFMSEDIVFSLKWRNMGNSVYVDTRINLKHSGANLYYGNFINYLNKINSGKG